MSLIYYYCVLLEMKNVHVCEKQKIQSELSSHDATLEDMRKKNQDKEPSQKIMGQIDLTQVLF